MPDNTPVTHDYGPLDEAIAELQRLMDNIDQVTLRDPMEALLVGLRAMLDCDERPCWLKSTDGRMLYLNPAYTKEFGKKIEDYGGRPDDFVWDGKISNTFSENDRKVMEQDRAIIFLENIAMPSGSTILYKIEKWPVHLEGKLIGVAGASLGQDDGRIGRR